MGISASLGHMLCFENDVTFFTVVMNGKVMGDGLPTYSSHNVGTYSSCFWNLRPRERNSSHIGTPFCTWWREEGRERERERERERARERGKIQYKSHTHIIIIYNCCAKLLQNIAINFYKQVAACRQLASDKTAHVVLAGTYLWQEDENHSTGPSVLRWEVAMNLRASLVA